MRRRNTIGIIALAIAASGCSDSSNSPAVVDNQAPTVSSIADIAVEANSVAVAFDVTVEDDITAPEDLAVTISNDNADLFEGGEIILDGSGADRRLLITPAPATVGSATLTVTVTDQGGLSTDAAFMITVTPQAAVFGTSVRNIFARGENDNPETVNDKEYNDETSDFNDLLGG
ncbi:Ig-like domain-containing protein [Congregibacter litoralis]|uniref:Uncharacterized protein n=1 Tax=Congregibacter litoralis KT71 TaxID=314285 RepID=A4A5T9_9GAMM|nr:Ig-like domain-containing protein [Congregibacter litoralis]EAQ98386.1 hypothetical protein KT71_00375 [Congregibacter litoralis KT71]